MTLHSSQLGRGGHRDDRRRRLLAEDRSADLASPEPSDAAGRSSSIVHKSENYGDADFLQSQLRLSDLVPRRPLVVALFLVLGLAATAGLAMLYLYAPALFRAASRRPIVVDLGSPGSLSNWFGSLLLLMAGFLAIIIYTVRRHKTDDYRGRYRVWLWWSGLCFLMAGDVAASLHEGIVQAIGSLAPMRPVVNHPVWWIIPTVLLLGTVGTRLFLDMRSCRLSSTALVLVAIAYLAALLAFYHVIRLPSAVGEVLLLHTSLLTGHLLLTWSMVLHTRYVLLDAEGRLPRSVAKPKVKKPRKEKSKAKAINASAEEGADADSPTSDTRESAEPEDDADDTWVAVDPPHPGGVASRPPLLKRVNSADTTADASFSQNTADSSVGSSFAASNQVDSKLSKADRKAMKKKLLDERLKAEQRKAANW
jgi:hypothetical protein